MTDAMEKILLGLKEVEVIRPTEGPSSLNDSEIRGYFETVLTPIVYPPYSITRNARIKDKEEQKPSEPTS